MATIRLNTEQITDWASFHFVCKEAFGFPDFYGENMDAWIDCVSYLTEEDGMTQLKISKDELLYIEITDTEGFNSRLPEIFDALVEGSAFVNNRYIQAKESMRISLIFL